MHTKIILTANKMFKPDVRQALVEACKVIADEYDFVVSVEENPPKRLVSIRQEQQPSNPRKNVDQLGTLYVRPNRYFEGDDGAKEPDGTELFKLPVYAYVHGAVRLSITPFNDPWDSGQCGWIYVTKESAEEMGAAPEGFAEALKAEIEEYDHYLNDNVWYVEITDEDDDIVDSCGGFIGDDIDECGIIGAFDARYNEALREAWENRYG